MIQKKPPRIFYGYIVVALSFVIMSASIGANNSFGVYLEPILDELHWSRAVTSGAYSLCLFLSGFLGILAGRLNDKFGTRVPIIISGVLFAISYFLLVNVNAVWQFYLYFGFIAGIAFAAGPVVPLLSASARWFKKRRSLMNGIITTGMGFGTLVLAQLSGGWIIQFGWRNSFAILSGICLIFVIVPALFLKPDPASVGQYPDGDAKPESNEKLTQQQSGLTLREAMKTRPLWMVSAAYVLLGIALFSVLAHIVIYATGTGLPRVNAVLLLTIQSSGNVISRLVMGAVGDRIGSRKTMLISVITLALAFLGFIVIKETWMLYLFVITVGVTWGGISVVMSPIAAELYGLRSHGTIFGVINFGFCLGATIGPILAGLIYDLTGKYDLDFQILTVLCGITILLTALAWRGKIRTN